MTYVPVTTDPFGKKRRYMRKPLSVSFQGFDASGDGDLYFESSDLSEGGTFLKSDLLLEPGEQLWLEFSVPGVPKMLRAQGLIRWVRYFPTPTEPGGMGIEFQSITEDERDMLSNYLEHLS